MNFSNRDAAAIGIQVLGLNLVFRYFQYLGMAFTRQMPITAATWCTTTIGLLGLGLALLFAARWLAIFVVRRKRILSLPCDCTTVDIQSIALSVLGVYIVIIGLGQLITAHQMQSEFPDMRRPLPWAAVVQLVMGVVLFVAGKRLACMWWRINNKTESQPEDGQLSSESALSASSDEVSS